MNKIENKKIIEDQIDNFLRAGDLSLELRSKGLVTKKKKDNTPVSNGDLEVNKIIVNKIKQVTPNIPIISEETTDNKNKLNLNNFWLVDPIDGTYDYINNLDEFTINAGLILNKKPVAGVIYAPAKKRLFYTFAMGETFEIRNNKLNKLNCSNVQSNKPLKLLSYSNNLKPEITKIHNRLKVKKYTRMKSSFKFCAIAASEYDGYVAEPRACEWDIAAGHAIVKNAGGIVVDFSGNEFEYGKKNFKNTSLIVLRSKELLWMIN